MKTALFLLGFVGLTVAAGWALSNYPTLSISHLGALSFGVWLDRYLPRSR